MLGDNIDMRNYATQIEESDLFKQFDYLVNHEKVGKADVEALKRLVLAVAEEVGPHLDRIRVTFSQYTEHDMRHLCNIADLVYRFLPKQGISRNKVRRIRLNAVELAFLWLSILLHDIGMYVSDTEKQDTLNSAEYQAFRNLHASRVEAAERACKERLEVKARAIEDALFAEYYRQRHAERARDYITNIQYKVVKLQFHEVSLADDVASLCESHVWGVREKNRACDKDEVVCAMPINRRIMGYRVNLQYLACCLRLGDILDFDRSRVPISVYDEIDFTEEESIKEWNKHLSINGWEIDEHRVLFDASCTHPTYFVAVHDFLNWVDNELRECHYLLDGVPAYDAEKYALTLAHVVDRRQVRMSDKRYVAGGFRFLLEYEEIMRLLMDKSLYPDVTLFLRELLQNALDACRYQEALAGEAGMGDKYIPRITVWDYSKDKDNPCIVFQDNGIGMSQRQVEQFFLRIGKSFYRSAEFEADRQRLARQGIHLSACSQFGIGFLSCFLGGDKIEVETYQYGCEPLHITITGPSKYFVIKRLPKVSDRIQFLTPSDKDADRPCLGHPGTRVTVHLKEGWFTPNEKLNHGVVYQTLENFAVNQEYVIKVYRGTSAIPLLCQKRKLEAMPLPFPHFRIEFFDVDESWLYSEQIAADQSLFIPSEFTLSKYNDELRGMGAIWMLKGLGGKPATSIGSLAMCGNSIVVSSPVLDAFIWLKNVVEGGGVGQGSNSRLLDDLSRYLAADCLDLASIRNILITSTRGWNEVDEGMKRLFKLTHTQCKLLSQLCTNRSVWHLPIEDIKWYQSKWALQTLIEGNDEELISGMEREGLLLDMQGWLGIGAFYSLALYGINCPGRICDWSQDYVSQDYVSHYYEMTPYNLAPDGVTLCIDSYGTLAPQPNVSRLFVPSANTRELHLAVGTAIIRHAWELYSPNAGSSDWELWYRIFLSGSLSELGDSLFQEPALVADHLTLRCIMNGEKTDLTIRQLCGYFGDFAPVVTKCCSDVSGILVAQDAFDYDVSRLTQYLPRRILSNNIDVFDLTNLQEKLGSLNLGLKPI